MNLIKRPEEEQKKAQPRLRVIKRGLSSANMPEGESARITDLGQRIGNILQDVSESLQPDNLSRIDRAEMQACFLALEQMKMLMSELEILRLFRSDPLGPSSGFVFSGNRKKVGKPLPRLLSIRTITRNRYSKMSTNQTPILCNQ
jgi:hypothetical protein